MGTDPSLLTFNVALGVLLVDILLSGDNAIVIALVCRTLSPKHRTKALWLGVMGAFLARVVLTSCATLVMSLPLIKLIGGILLLKISIELIVDNDDQGTQQADPKHSSVEDVFSAARTIILADIVMSLDNVLALSAITQNNWQMLVAGLLLSIPILMFGSLYISRLLNVFPYLLWVGGAILGGVSGSLIIDDPIFDGAFNNASSMATLLVPLLSAGFVVQMSKVIGVNARELQSVPQPRSIFSILWPGALAKPVMQADTAPISEDLVLQPIAVAHSALLDVTEEAEAILLPQARANPSARQSVGEYRVIAALGIFMALTGGTLYYFLNVYQPPTPDLWATYACNEPAMSVSLRPGTNEIRFATSKGAVVTSFIEDRIVWEDYREAGAKLTLPPPIKLVSIDADKLVVNGGVFENTACLVVRQRREVNNP